MEDYSAEEEESWYDHQDLEQGEYIGEGNSVCPKPLTTTPLLGGIT